VSRSLVLECIDVNAARDLLFPSAVFIRVEDEESLYLAPDQIILKFDAFSCAYQQMEAAMVTF
jgi:hypothetical protein